MHPFSTRSSAEQEPNELARELVRFRASGRRLFDLTESNPTRAGVPYAESAILGALSDPRVLGYEPEPFGPRRAREAVCAEWRRTGFEVPPERVLLTASTSEAYSYLFKLLCDPGDEVLVPAPSYPLFEHLARLENVTPVRYALGFDGAWFIDVERVRERITKRTRAISIVSPNNPTGSVLKKTELVGLAGLGLPLIADEVFGSFVLEPNERAARSALESADTLVFALSGLSKLAALPQMKIAWTTLSGPDALVEAALSRLELVADTFLSPSTPALVALPALLESRGSSERAILARLRANRATLVGRVAGSALTALPVEGGWSAVVRLPKTRPEEDWALGLLRDAGVLAQPGYFYDFEDEPYLVVSLITPEGEFESGVERLVEYAKLG